jgi:hypothetical protein
VAAAAASDSFVVVGVVIIDCWGLCCTIVVIFMEFCEVLPTKKAS